MRPMARFSMLDGKLYPAAVFLGVDSLKLQSLDFWGSLRSASSLIRRYGCPLFRDQVQHIRHIVVHTQTTKLLR